VEDARHAQIDSSQMMPGLNAFQQVQLSHVIVTQDLLMVHVKLAHKVRSKIHQSLHNVSHQYVVEPTKLFLQLTVPAVEDARLATLILFQMLQGLPVWVKELQLHLHVDVIRDYQMMELDALIAHSDLPMTATTPEIALLEIAVPQVRSLWVEINATDANLANQDILLTKTAQVA
jgi:hypothetical protein